MHSQESRRSRRQQAVPAAIGGSGLAIRSLLLITTLLAASTMRIGCTPAREVKRASTAFTGHRIENIVLVIFHPHMFGQAKGIRVQNGWGPTGLWQHLTSSCTRTSRQGQARQKRNRSPPETAQSALTIALPPRTRMQKGGSSTMILVLSIEQLRQARRTRRIMVLGSN